MLANVEAMRTRLRSISTRSIAESTYREVARRRSIASWSALSPVKSRVREIAALLLVEKLRRSLGLQADRRRCT